MKVNEKRKRVYMPLVTMILLLIMILLPSSEVSAKTTINSSKVTLKVGETKMLKISGTKKKVKWSTSKKSVATVSNLGKITAKGKGTAVITAKVGSNKLNCKVFVYKADSGDKKVDKKIDSIIKKEIKSTMSTLEKVIAIHDYLLLNCEYDRECKPFSYTVKGAILNKKAVCSGYAEAFQEFMDALNIPCKTVIGKASNQGHAWNMVKISGKWYHVDVTWDDPIPDEKGRVEYDYFCVSDSRMKATHKWNRSEYPKCAENCSKAVELVFGPVSKTSTQGASNLLKQYKQGKKELIFVFEAKVSDNGRTIFSSNGVPLLKESLGKMEKKLGKTLKSYKSNKVEFFQWKYGIFHVTVTFE